MKKAILIALLLVLAQQCSNAQITNSVWGLTNGKSSKQDVERVLREKGYNFTEERNRDNTISLKIGSSYGKKVTISFAGEEWTNVYFEIYQNTLYDISFWNFSCKNGYTVLDRLEDKLDKKYNDPTFKKEQKEDRYSNKPTIYYRGDTYYICKEVDYEGYPSYRYGDRKTNNYINIGCTYNTVHLSFYNGSWLHRISQAEKEEL